MRGVLTSWIRQISERRVATPPLSTTFSKQHDKSCQYCCPLFIGRDGLYCIHKERKTELAKLFTTFYKCWNSQRHINTLKLKKCKLVAFLPLRWISWRPSRKFITTTVPTDRKCISWICYDVETSLCCLVLFKRTSGAMCFQVNEPSHITIAMHPADNHSRCDDIVYSAKYGSKSWWHFMLHTVAHFSTLLSGASVLRSGKWNQI